MSTRCSAWARAVRGRSTAGRGASSRCSSIAAARSTRWSRAGRATCTDRAIPVPMLLGTGGWGLFVAAPWVQVDLATARPRRLHARASRPEPRAPRRPSATSSRTPARACRRSMRSSRDSTTSSSSTRTIRRGALKDFSTITGPAVLPPRWALGYMQSHRTLEDDRQMIGIIDTFRSKQIPLDAVIYLGTGFAPRGWNTRQPSFEFNPDVFTRDPKAVLADMHARHVKVVVHMVPWDRDRLPTLHGTIPARPGEAVDASHIQSYWQQHVPLVTAGIDAFWPDEGDWFNLFERIKRHQLYYQGHLSTQPERAAVEPAAQRLPRHRAVGRMGVVGRHRVVVEDARSADRGRHQLLAQHRAVLGLGHRRLLSEQRADRRAVRALAPVRRLLRIVPLARPHLVHAPAVGLGLERHGPARVQQHERADSARRPPQHPAVGAEQSRRSSRSPGNTRSCATSSCRTPTRSRGRRAIAACR